MKHLRAPCPFLPESRGRMSYLDLRKHGEARDARFYVSALGYGNYLWQRGHSGRAILALTRALYANVPPEDPVLRQHPLPYAAIGWIVENHQSEDFPGNPRVSFQHQAQRLRGERAGLRRSRAWAAWAVVRAARPSLCGDHSENLSEPTLDQITAMLDTHGSPSESGLWRSIVARWIAGTQLAESN